MVSRHDARVPAARVYSQQLSGEGPEHADSHPNAHANAHPDGNAHADTDADHNEHPFRVLHANCYAHADANLYAVDHTHDHQHAGTVEHAEIRIGDAVIMAFDAPQGTPPQPAFIRLYLPDARIAFAKAIQAGGTEVTKPTLLAFGDRVARVRDPLGNIWWLQQHVEDVSEEEMGKRWTDPAWSTPMAYVQESLANALRQ